MSREEAIKELTELLPEEFLSEYSEAIRMAIKALEQEPCEDAISRQEVLEEINRVGVKGFETYNDYSQLYDFVDTLPSVTPQPEMGHWEWNQYDANPKIGNFHCSLCHNIGESYYDYCPNCGAKMQEVER